jgi:hypothetical protein
MSLFNRVQNTLPYFSNQLNTMGQPRPTKYNLQTLSLSVSTSDNVEYWNKWCNDAKKEALDKVHNTIRAKSKMLYPIPQQPKSGNSGPRPLGIMQDMANYPFPSTSLKGGYLGNVSVMQGYTPQEMENIRKNLLEKRAREYEALTNQKPLPIASIPSGAMQNKFAMDLALTNIEDRINNGLADNTTFNDMNKLTMFFQQHISDFDNAFDIVQYISRLDNLAFETQKLIKDRDVLKSKDDQYAEVLTNAMYRLSYYLKENLETIGSSVDVRKIKQQSTAKLLRPKLGKEPEPVSAVLPSRTKISKASVSELRGIATRYGVPFDPTNAYKDPLKDAIFSKFKEIYPSY